MGSRRKARELVLQAIYALELSGNPKEQVLEGVILASSEPPATITFAAQLFRLTVENTMAFDELIKSRTDNWELDRIAILDKILLKMALCEFLHFQDIPPKVSIDEAIEIAKIYSTENSGRFINGILDALLNDLEKAGRVQKAGRGLDDAR